MACREGQIQVLEYWLCGDSPQPGLLYSTQYQTDFNSDTTGPLLYLAAEFGQERVVRMLLASGLYPNLPDSTGRTAVSAACQEGHLEVVRLLHAKCGYLPTGLGIRHGPCSLRC